MAVFHDFTQVRGAGELVSLPGLSARYQLGAELLGFVNFSGPTGSFKDSLAEGLTLAVSILSDLCYGSLALP